MILAWWRLSWRVLEMARRVKWRARGGKTDVGVFILRADNGGSPGRDIEK